MTKNQQKTPLCPISTPMLDRLPWRAQCFVFKQLDPLEIKYVLFAFPAVRQLFQSFVTTTLPKHTSHYFYDDLGYHHIDISGYALHNMAYPEKMNLIEITDISLCGLADVWTAWGKAIHTFIVITCHKELGEPRFDPATGKTQVVNYVPRVGVESMPTNVNMLFYDPSQTRTSFNFRTILDLTDSDASDRVLGNIKVYIPHYMSQAVAITTAMEISSTPDLQIPPYYFNSLPCFMDFQSFPIKKLTLIQARGNLWVLRRKVITAKNCVLIGAKAISDVLFVNAHTLHLATNQIPPAPHHLLTFTNLSAPMLKHLTLHTVQPHVFPLFFGRMYFPALESAQLINAVDVQPDVSMYTERDLTHEEIQSALTTADFSLSQRDFSFLHSVSMLHLCYFVGPLLNRPDYSLLTSLRIQLSTQSCMNREIVVNLPRLKVLYCLYVLGGTGNIFLPRFVTTTNIEIIYGKIQWNYQEYIGFPNTPPHPRLQNLLNAFGSRGRSSLQELTLQFSDLSLDTGLSYQLEEVIYSYHGLGLTSLRIDGVDQVIFRKNFGTGTAPYIFPALKTLRVGAEWLKQRSLPEPDSSLPNISLDLIAPKLNSIKILGFRGLGRYSQIAMLGYQRLTELIIDIDGVDCPVKFAGSLPRLKSYRVGFMLYHTEATL